MSNKHGSKWIRPEKRRRIYERDGWACVWCGKRQGVDASPLVLDHLVPRSAGGSNHESNLVTSCKSCNDRRQDKPLGQWLTALLLENFHEERILRALARAIDSGAKKKRKARKKKKQVSVDTSIMTV